MPALPKVGAQPAFPLDYEIHLQAGEDAARRTIDLDPELADAHAALASIRSSYSPAP